MVRKSRFKALLRVLTSVYCSLDLPDSEESSICRRGRDNPRGRCSVKKRILGRLRFCRSSRRGESRRCYFGRDPNCPRHRCIGQRANLLADCGDSAKVRCQSQSIDSSLSVCMTLSLWNLGIFILDVFFSSRLRWRATFDAINILF